MEPISQNYFDSTANEIIVEVFEFLDINNKLSLGTTCRKMRAISGNYLANPLILRANMCVEQLKDIISSFPGSKKMFSWVNKKVIASPKPDNLNKHELLTQIQILSKLIEYFNKKIIGMVASDQAKKANDYLITIIGITDLFTQFQENLNLQNMKSLYDPVLYSLKCSEAIPTKLRTQAVGEILTDAGLR
jgi:hypothetical protein